MELIRGIHNIRPHHSESDDGRVGTVLTIGAFDGLHKGHQVVLEHLCESARNQTLPSLVVTLEPLPREYFSPLDAPPRLMSIREKYEGLANLGINRLLVITFNDNLRNMQPIDFIKKVFVDGLRVKHIIVGDDFRFGKDGVGNFELLVSLGKKYNFTVENTATIEQKEQRVSSTRIRKFLENADFFSAKNMLGKSYSISGKVIYGDQLGREIGVPTANLELHRLRTALSGVYAVNVKIDNSNEWLQGIANVGCRPTINDSIKAILEVHILNFDKNIYGKRITVRFLKKIRDEIKFESIEILKSQIFKDLDIVKIYFGD